MYHAPLVYPVGFCSFGALIPHWPVFICAHCSFVASLEQSEAAGASHYIGWWDGDDAPAWALQWQIAAFGVGNALLPGS